jgi:hypothetical protein
VGGGCGKVGVGGGCDPSSVVYEEDDGDSERVDEILESHLARHLALYGLKLCERDVLEEEAPAKSGTPVGPHRR